MKSSDAQRCAAFIQERYNTTEPTVGIILGSGLKGPIELLSESHQIPYGDIPGFPFCTVQGHAGKLHLGKLHHTSVVCCEGRIHLYEGAVAAGIKTVVRTLKLIGCETLIVTNAAGSLYPNTPVGHLVLIKDHINFQLTNPLVGKNDDEFGVRFTGMEDAYDSVLREKFQIVAKRCRIPLTEGVFAGMLGPSFETPAEIQMLKILGADVVAMSLIPEVIVARHCGMRVAAISAISNLAAGLQPEKLSHEVTLRGVKKAEKHLTKLLSEFFL